VRKIFVVAVLVLGVLGSVSAKSTGWTVGYRVGVDGFSAPSLSQHEYISLYGVYEPFRNISVNPSIQLGVMFPTVTANSHTALLTLGIGSGVFVFQDHIFDKLFRRDSALIPRVDAYVTYNSAQGNFETAALVIHPLSFYFGDKYVGLLGVQVVRNLATQDWGWGIRLFEISHYLW
jgi:hypothetical protein